MSVARLAEPDTSAVMQPERLLPPASPRSFLDDLSRGHTYGVSWDAFIPPTQQIARQSPDYFPTQRAVAGAIEVTG